MSVKPSRLGSCLIADYAALNPVYHALAQLTVVHMAAEAKFLEAQSIGGGADTEFVPAGNKTTRIVLKGYADDGAGEALLHSGFSEQSLRLLRMDTPQGQRITGAFWVTHFSRALAVDAFYRCEAELLSHGEVSVVAL